tara:strand:+ start:13 stop:987 length:975 start_codon:yes stop_codon:yes gene_type:complete
MAILATVRSLLKFSNTALLDEVDNAQYTASTDTADIEVKEGKTCLHMAAGQTISNSSRAINVSTQMSVSFWLFSVSPGVVAHPIDGLLNDLKMPILDITSGGNNYLLIYESTEENGTNRLNVWISDQSGSTFSGQTPSYEIGVWHYVWVKYNGGTPEVYLDGTLQVLENTGGVAPTSLGLGSVSVAINGTALGSEFDIASNTGWIDDFLLMNDASDPIASSQTVVNEGIDYLTDSTYTTSDEIGFGVLFDDPTDANVNSAYGDGSYIYLARSDGRLLRGSPLVWESRRDFSNEEEADTMTISGESSGYSFDDKILKITNATVSL